MSENFDKYNHSDVIKKFVADSLQITLNYNDFWTVKNLYLIYKSWCVKNKFRTTSILFFVREMKKIEGIEHTRQRIPNTYKTQNAVHMFRYIKLKA